jgi:hypothetical protein
MHILRKALWGILILALGFGILLAAERLTIQELTRVSLPSTQETVCLMWKPRLLKRDGTCDLELLNAQGKVVDSVRLGILDAGFEALQQFGQLEVQEPDVSVTSKRTGELVRRFTVQAGHLRAAD